MTPRIHAILKDTFRTGITVKGIDGVLETIGGVLLWLVHPAALGSLAQFLFHHELSRDPHDIIAAHLFYASQDLLSGNKMFASLYLLSHGITKVVLVVALWMNELWAYSLTIFVFAVFSAYQMYRYSQTHSIAMLLLTIFDLALIYLTWLEWREQQAAHAKRIPA